MRELIKQILREETDYRLPESHPMVVAIEGIINRVNEYNDWYTQPFSDDDEQVDYHIKYNVNRVSLWQEDDGDYSGTVYININDILLGDLNSDEWVRVYWRDDLPSWTWDRLEEDIIMRVEKWIPNIGVDIELIFPGPKN